MELYPTLWIQKYQIKNEAGVPIEFDNHFFMYDLYNDMSPLQVWLKPPQIGATVAQIVKSLYCAKKNQWDIIYTLPTNSDVNDMAGGKINRIIAQNPILNQWVKDHDTVEQKSVGKNIIYYRGTYTNKAAMMVSSDLNIHDEVDASDASVIAQYETRLQAKADNRRWYFSHPSLSGFGVDIQWQQSDKKEWFIKCNHCDKEQQLKWPENVNIQSRQYVCSVCGNCLDTASRKNGQWKPTATGPFSGYHISQLMCPWITAEKIILDYEQKDRQYFYNYVLGLPYVSSDDKIASDVVLKNCTNTVNNQDDTIIIGVDTGLPIHYTLLNKEGVFYYGTCKPPSADYDPYSTLEGFLLRWPKAIIIADQGGDLIGIRKLQAKYPGRVFLCYYQKDRKTQEIIRWGEGDEYGVVKVDRNRMMSLTVEHIRDIGRIRLNGSVEDFTLFASHFDNIYREKVIVKESTGKDAASLYGNEYVWKRNGDDHFVHTLVYALVGLDKYATSMATIVMPNMMQGIEQGRIFNSLD